jgi:hypothetical protein
VHAAEEAERRERIREKRDAGPGTAQGLTRSAAPTCDAGAKPLPASAGGSELPKAGGGLGLLPVCVGDQRCFGRLEDRQRLSPTAPYAVEEPRDAPPVAPLPTVQTPSPAREEHGAVEWLLVVPPEMLAAALRREGTLATCSFCGRSGRIGRVVSTEQWQHWIRRGLDPP